MKTRKILFYVFLSVAVLINAFIIVESCIGEEGSAAQSLSISEAIANMIENISPGTIQDHDAFHSAIRKIVGHFLLFGLSGTFVALTFIMNDFMMNKFKWINILYALAFGLTIALVTELIQLFVPGRYGALTDVFIDFAGFVLFFGIVFLVYFLVIRHKSKQASDPSNA